MRTPIAHHRFLGLFPPYHTVEVIEEINRFPKSPLPPRGAALLWNVCEGDLASGIQAVRDRVPGVSLILLLPPPSEMRSNRTLLDLEERCRPHSILPFMKEVSPEEIAAILRRFPSNFDLEVVDYLVWRGIDVDLDTRRLLRKTFALSDELRTVNGLARGLYMSRRALGRRFMTRGLPVPSHWLHFGRILRASIRMQAPSASLFSIGCDLGYPDGFSLSNQLKRLTGLRPSIMRECFGWDWIVESWLLQEARSGSFSRKLRETLFPDLLRFQDTPAAPMAGPRRSLRVAERGPKAPKAASGNGHE
jgi:hypothetical protein